ncbi:MAG: SLBB domain-containing protein [Rhodothermales bacterium]
MTHTMRIGSLYAILAVCFFALPSRSYAQQEDSPPRRVAFYRHVEPGQATMRVSVWGDVTAPGRYEVKAGTDLVELIFLAGGASEQTQRSNEKRKTSVLVSRKAGTSWSSIFEAPLEDITEHQLPYPALQDEDVVKLETVVSRTFSWRDGFTVVGALGTIALVIERISRASK